MVLPKFLVADNSEFPENVYVVHMQKPRFIIDVDSEEIKWLGNEPEGDDVIAELIKQAMDFYETELENYEDEEDEE